MTNRGSNGWPISLQGGDHQRDAQCILTPRASIYQKRDENNEKQEEELSKKRQEEENQFADKIEVFARVFFPFCYMLFNVFYWTNYLLAEDLPEETI